MSDIIIKNGLIVTMDPEGRVTKGSVSIEDDRIKEIGGTGEEADKVINAEGKIVMPGLVCSYSRPYRVFLKSILRNIEPPTDFTQILQRIWWPLDEVLSDDDIHIGTLVSCLKFIKTGTTFFVGLHSSQESIGKSLDYVASAIEKSGIRARIAYESSERHTHAEGARGMKENIRFLERKRKSEESLVEGLVGLGCTFTTSDELLRHGERVSNRFDVPMALSVSEGKVDLYHSLENYGKRPVERLRDLGILNSNTVLAHCVHLNDDEISLIKKADSKVAHCPMGNMLNASGVAPIPDMTKKKVLVGIGNDGYIFDGFENMRFSCLVHKGVSRDPRSISSMDVLEMATINGAKSYGLEKEIGSIEPGKKADIIVINPPSMFSHLTRENIADFIVNNVRGCDVETMIVDGKIVMKNRNIKTLREETIMKKSVKVTEKIWKNLEL